MQFGLNKYYLSHSAIDLWLKSPVQYRERYYKRTPQIVTPELSFGKKIATLLENADESMAHIPRLSVSEHKIEALVEDVPILAYLDSYEPTTKTIFEFKTGKQPWTDARVKKHKQLDLYSLLVEITEGSVDDKTTLVWMQTERVDLPQIGLMAHSDAYDIKLTGEVRTFERIITTDERQAMRDTVLSVSEEIQADYKAWLSQRSLSTVGLR